MGGNVLVSPTFLHKRFSLNCDLLKDNKISLWSSRGSCLLNLVDLKKNDQDFKEPSGPSTRGFEDRDPVPPTTRNGRTLTDLSKTRGRLGSQRTKKGGNPSVPSNPIPIQVQTYLKFTFVKKFQGLQQLLG